MLSVKYGQSAWLFTHRKVSHRKVAHPKLKINNWNVERVVNFNLLWSLISANSKWNCHIDHLSRNISRVVGIMNATNKRFPSSIYGDFVSSIGFQLLFTDMESLFEWFQAIKEDDAHC